MLVSLKLMFHRPIVSEVMTMENISPRAGFEPTLLSIPNRASGTLNYPWCDVDVLYLRGQCSLLQYSREINLVHVTVVYRCLSWEVFEVKIFSNNCWCAHRNAGQHCFPKWSIFIEIFPSWGSKYCPEVYQIPKFKCIISSRLCFWKSNAFIGIGNFIPIQISTTQFATTTAWQRGSACVRHTLNTSCEQFWPKGHDLLLKLSPEAAAVAGSADHQYCIPWSSCRPDCRQVFRWSPGW